MPSAISKLEAERAEVDAVLYSGVLGRASNIVRLLSFVCEKYFDGAVDEIKEYSIAVGALGRSESFDPQADTIVRVSAHALRKRLEEYYRGAGAEHAVHICLPPGHYVPKFIHKNEVECAKVQAKLGETSPSAPAQESALWTTGRDNLIPSGLGIMRQEASPESQGAQSRGRPRFAQVVKMAAIVFTASVLLIFGLHKTSRKEGDPWILAAIPSSNGSLTTVRAMAATSLAPYLDQDGAVWQSDQFCSGGSSFSVSGHTIQGTDDPQLFSNGRRGIFHCKYPVPPGTYEVHLLFAETGGLQENSRNVRFSVNGGPEFNLDVADDAGGDDIATTKVLADVAPDNDGSIHLDFSTPESFLNAVEIIPTYSHQVLPMRIVVGHRPYRDSRGNVWVSDRYFFGGRLSSFATNLSTIPDGRLYEWHRFGHFHYIVPVASRREYTLKLYFMEHWFGDRNGGIGGVGSRVFDVSCNGTMLLKGFDIFREAGSEPLVKSFQHIEPTPQGKIEIYFTPAVNYPSISAIEVAPE
jgi:hypothetical protein